MKLVVPATLFLCLLSGAGIDALRQEWTGRQRRWMILVAVAVALVAVGGAAAAPRPRRGLPRPSARLSRRRPPADVPDRLRSAFVRLAVAGRHRRGSVSRFAPRAAPASRALAAAGALALIDLFAAARGAIRLAPAELLRHRPPLLDAFPDPDQHRLYSFQYGLAWLNQQFTRPPAGWNPEWAWALGHAERLTPPIPTRWRISGSFDGDFTGLTPVALVRLTALVHSVRSEPAGAPAPAGWLR